MTSRRVAADHLAPGVVTSVALWGALASRSIAAPFADLDTLMDALSTFTLAFAIGVITGLRSMMAPAALAWGARLRWLDFRQTWAHLLASHVIFYILTALALLELLADKLPQTPSRKKPGPFAARIVLGALSGAALCAAARHSSIAGGVFGCLGAVAGTLGGYQARTRLVKAWKTPDYVVALLEDAIAIGGGLLIVSCLS